MGTPPSTGNCVTVPGYNHATFGTDARMTCLSRGRMGDIRWGSMLTLGVGARKSRLLGVVVSLALLNRSFDAQTISVTAQSEPKRVEIAAYREHLSNLHKLVERCEEKIST